MKPAQVIFGSLFVLLAVTGAMWYFSPRPPKAEGDGGSDKIVVANIGQFSIFNLIAQDKGFFAQNGLDATVDEYDSGATSVAALLSGKADVAIAGDFVVVTNMFSHPEIRIISEVGHQDVFRLIVRTDKGIHSPSDLAGKTVGVTKGAAGEFYLGRFLGLHDVPSEEVTTVDLSPTGMEQQLEEGTVDAIMIFEPHAYALKQKLGPLIDVWPGQGEEDARALAFTTSAYVASHPKVIEKYLRALMQADDYAVSHEAESRALVSKRMGYSDEYIAAVWPKHVYHLGLNQDTLVTLEHEARWSIATGYAQAEAVPNYLDLMYFTALEKVRPERVTILH